MIKLKSYLENRIREYNNTFKKYPEEIIKGKRPDPIYILDGKGKYLMSWMVIRKLQEDGIHSELMKKFNFSDPIERQLSRINGFYEVLNKLWEVVNKEGVVMLEKKIKMDASNAINWESDVWQDIWEFGIWYDYEWRCKWELNCKGGCIIAGYSEYQYGSHIEWLERWEDYNRYECYSKKEFYLLMNIYWWIYDDERLKKELEEKERKWEYDNMLMERLEIEKKLAEHTKKAEEIEKKKWLIERLKYDDEFMNWYYNKRLEEFYKKYKDKWEEYLKLQLIRKDTTWVFPELKIRKIYDANWSEEEQRRVIEKINKELGKEVVILE